MPRTVTGINYIAIRDWIRALFWSSLFVFFLTGYICKGFKIEGGSMNPLLHHGDFVLADKLTARWSGYHRQDIVVFQNPAEPGMQLIKRILAEPGDMVEIRSGDVYINGTRQAEAYVIPEFRSAETIRPTRVPRGFYFVAGDHRTNSNDSRVWALAHEVYPFVPERCIEGRIIFRFWPVQAIGTVQ